MHIQKTQLTGGVELSLDLDGPLPGPVQQCTEATALLHKLPVPPQLQALPHYAGDDPPIQGHVQQAAPLVLL